MKREVQELTLYMPFTESDTLLSASYTAPSSISNPSDVYDKPPTDGVFALMMPKSPITTYS